MTDRELMQQALEALELLAKWEHPASNITTKNGGRIYPHKVASDAAAALRAAIEQAQEPVAWMHPSWIDPDTRGWESDSFNAIPIEGWVPVYTAPVDAVNIKLKHVDETAKRAHELGELKEKNNG